MSNFLVDSDGYLIGPVFEAATKERRPRLDKWFLASLISTLTGAVIVVGLIVADVYAPNGTVMNNFAFVVLMAGILLFAVGLASFRATLRFPLRKYEEMPDAAPPEDLAHQFIDWAFRRYGLALTAENVATLLGYTPTDNTLTIGATTVMIGTPDDAPAESKFGLIAPGTRKEMRVRR